MSDHKPQSGLVPSYFCANFKKDLEKDRLVNDVFLRLHTLFVCLFIFPLDFNIEQCLPEVFNSFILLMEYC